MYYSEGNRSIFMMDILKSIRTTSFDKLLQIFYCCMNSTSNSLSYIYCCYSSLKVRVLALTDYPSHLKKKIVSTDITYTSNRDFGSMTWVKSWFYIGLIYTYFYWGRKKSPSTPFLLSFYILIESPYFTLHLTSLT